MRKPKDIYGDGRALDLYGGLTSGAHEAVSSVGVEEASGEMTRITREWKVRMEPSATEMMRVAARDLERFLKEGLNVTLRGRRTTRQVLRVVVDAVRGSVSGDSAREHVITVGAEEIEIVGATEWGAACGLYHVQRLLKLRGARWLPRGEIRAHTRLEPAITSLAFKRGATGSLDYPLAYHDNYLIRLARAGYSGFHVDPGFELFFRSELLPELDHPKADANLGILAKIVARARKYGLKVFLTPYLPFLPVDHAVFQRHPEVLGSELSASKGLHVLCTGQERVQRFYEEQAARLFRLAPGLGGLFLISGGEAFLHCYTAPRFRPENSTQCPVCRKRDPATSVAELVNGIARVVKEVAPEGMVVVWTYNAFTWSPTPAAAAHVAALSEDCIYMGNFDTGDPIEREGVTSVSGDYSLTVIGPGGTYAQESRAALAKGLKVMAKVESGCPREIHGIPSIPAMTRWGEKYARVIASGATGAMFSWQFSGFTESLSEELAGWMSWSPCLPVPALLERLAARDFGTKRTAGVMDAWRCFDRAMESFPFSSWTSSFRQGPFSIGFAQPLILDTSKPGELPETFWLRGSKERPRFISDLHWTHPFGVDGCLASLKKSEHVWLEGCEALEAQMAEESGDPAMESRLKAHWALARSILCMLRTAIHTVRFLEIRDRYFREAADLSRVRQRLTEMREIAKLELTNAEDGARCMPHNARIGFDYMNDQIGFSEAMVRSKIAHTRWVIDWQLPYQMFLHSYGMCSRDEWIRDDGSLYR